MTPKFLLFILVPEIFARFLSTKEVHKIIENPLFSKFSHTPVLLTEVLDGMMLRGGETVVDATLGLGGHAAAILEKIGPKGRLFGFDRDPRNREIAAQNLVKYKNLEIIPAPFSRLSAEMTARGVTQVDAILFDLGISSAHLDDAKRGFSFRFSAPLDLRMDPEIPETAADLCHRLSPESLAEILWKYGEEPRSRRLSAEIANSPPKTTDELFSLIETISKTPKKTAARVFQALRIAVNDEIGELESALPQAAELLVDGGCLAVIAFHSLEDRIAKNFIRTLSFTRKGETREWQRITKKPIVPTADESLRNPRSRSARLRILRKI